METLTTAQKIVLLVFGSGFCLLIIGFFFAMFTSNGPKLNGENVKSIINTARMTEQEYAVYFQSKMIAESDEFRAITGSGEEQNAVVEHTSGLNIKVEELYGRPWKWHKRAPSSNTKISNKAWYKVIQFKRKTPIKSSFLIVEKKYRFTNAYVNFAKEQFNLNDNIEEDTELVFFNSENSEQECKECNIDLFRQVKNLASENLPLIWYETEELVEIYIPGKPSIDYDFKVLNDVVILLNEFNG